MLRLTTLLTIGLLATSVQLKKQTLEAPAISTKVAGVVASVDSDVMKKFKDYILPSLVSEINSIDIGKIEFDGGYIDNTKLNMVINNPNTLDFSFSGAQNAFILKASDIQGSFSGSFYYKYLMVAVKGNFEVTILEGGCTLDSIIKMTTSNVGGRMLPAIGV